MAFSDFSPPEMWFTQEEGEAIQLMTPEEADAEFEKFTWTEDRKHAWMIKWRNTMLVWSDWTVLPDSPLSDSDKALWMTFRQELRDMPSQNVPVDDMIIPVQPWGVTPTSP